MWTSANVLDPSSGSSPAYWYACLPQLTPQNPEVFWFNELIEQNEKKGLMSHAGYGEQEDPWSQKGEPCPDISWVQGLFLLHPKGIYKDAKVPLFIHPFSMLSLTMASV